MKIILQYLILIFLLSSCGTNNETIKESNITTGPAQGSLILVGGHLQSAEIYQKFIELAGGIESNYVIILTAAEDKLLNDSSFILKTQKRFLDQGIKNLTLLHTRNLKIANSNEFLEPIRKANGLWFIGGRQWRLVDAYMDTKAFDEFNKLLERGGVIGGSSAGATIQGSYLVRGDTKTNTIMMGDHQEGFGFIKNIAVDQHLLAMNRQFDIFEIMDAHPGLLGLGLDENTAIVVQGDEFEVIGEHYVAVYDGTFFAEIRDKEDWNIIRYIQKPLQQNEQKFYLLKRNQRYNMSERRVIK